jgi:hypothetical protein
VAHASKLLRKFSAPVDVRLDIVELVEFAGGVLDGIARSGFLSGRFFIRTSNMRWHHRTVPLLQPEGRYLWMQIALPRKACCSRVHIILVLVVKAQPVKRANLNLPRESRGADRKYLGVV